MTRARSSSRVWRQNFIFPTPASRTEAEPRLMTLVIKDLSVSEELDA